MNVDLLELATFRVTGKKSGDDLDDVGDLNLRPILFSHHGDLTTLRYDYPLVLVKGGDDAGIRSLSDVVDGVLRDVAPEGIKGERLRQQLIGLETEIRTLVARGTQGALSKLIDLAGNNLLSRADEPKREQLTESLDAVRAALKYDGTLIDCSENAPDALLTHAWTAVQRGKNRLFAKRVDEIILKLSDILKADYMKSEAARTPDTLKGSVGTSYEDVFDFEAMSQILGRAPTIDPLPDSRKQRIESALAVLECQKFFAPTDGGAGKKQGEGPFQFIFNSCTDAVDAFEVRMPEMVALIKAISIAELEIDNRYKESKHELFFSRFDESSLRPADLELFPSYLVCIRDHDCSSAEKTKLIEVLSSDLPVKILVQSDDLLDDLSTRHASAGIRGCQLASVALGLNTAYVLQSSSSCLYQLRDRIGEGLAYPGPALFSVFSGATEDNSVFPPYLMAASAMESRAFPAFTYDPAAGSDWASRFGIGDNPRADIDWPVYGTWYEDEDLQKISLDVAFTFVEFVACDPRYAVHFARVPRSDWDDDMMPVTEYLERETDAVPDRVPYILMADESNVIHRIVVDDQVVHAARRCREMWHSLQELGGINSSHARKLLDKERERWEQEKERELAELRSQLEQGASQAAPAVKPAETAEPAPAEAATVEEAAVEEPPSDEAYIETPRCTTCDECTQINGKMFAYDDNKQAYIADIDAGSYRQLVEAAESCQVSIIHPGKPRNPDEPNLEDLVQRAEPFL